MAFTRWSVEKLALLLLDNASAVEYTHYSCPADADRAADCAINMMIAADACHAIAKRGDTRTKYTALGLQEHGGNYYRSASEA